MRRRRSPKKPLKNLKSEHEDVLVKAGHQGWDEATDAPADQIYKLKDVIYKVGYDFSLENPGIPSNHEFHSKDVLCRLGLSLLQL